MRKLKPVTPGELLLEEFLKPMEISQYRLEKEIGVPAQRIGDIVAGKRTITVPSGADGGQFLTLLSRLISLPPLTASSALRR
ncbi:MAG: HigA family addiction module antidote protein [Nitrospira sp.]|nr:HigA family addiction module antidote protein [Nitrospira sp.]